jgi:hypothetical protein
MDNEYQVKEAVDKADQARSAHQGQGGQGDPPTTEGEG